MEHLEQQKAAVQNTLGKVFGIFSKRKDFTMRKFFVVWLEEGKVASLQAQQEEIQEYFSVRGGSSALLKKKLQDISNTFSSKIANQQTRHTRQKDSFVNLLQKVTRDART
eukprot:757110-Hanusia_phi.AAC.3